MKRISKHQFPVWYEKARPTRCLAMRIAEEEEEPVPPPSPQAGIIDSRNK